MSDLAFLSSEDEAELDNTKNNKDVSTSVDNAGDTESGSDSDDSSAEEFVNDFEFGGLLVSHCDAMVMLGQDHYIMFSVCFHSIIFVMLHFSILFHCLNTNITENIRERTADNPSLTYCLAQGKTNGPTKLHSKYWKIMIPMVQDQKEQMWLKSLQQLVKI